MKKFSLFFLLLPLLQSNTVGDFPVEIKLIAPFNTRNIQLQVVVKNRSATPVRIFKNRKQAFKRNTETSSANYIIELEKWAGNGYYLLEPVVAGIVPEHSSGEEYVLFHSEKTITDTLSISAQSFSNDMPSYFTPGLYRVRVSFNVNGWNSMPVNQSDWVEFVLQ